MPELANGILAPADASTLPSSRRCVPAAIDEGVAARASPIIALATRRERHRTRSELRCKPGNPRSEQFQPRPSAIASPLVFHSGLNLGPLRYETFFARVAYVIWPWTYLLSILNILFFDYTALYTLTQIARYPGPQEQRRPSHVSGQPLVNIWWLLFAFYGCASVVGFLGIIAFHDMYLHHYLLWRRGATPRCLQGN